MAEIRFDLTADVADFERALSGASASLAKTKADGDAAAKSTDKVGESSKAAGQKVGFAAGSFREINAQMQKTAAHAPGLADALEDVGDAAEDSGGWVGSLTGQLGGMINPATLAAGGLTGAAAAALSLAAHASAAGDAVALLSVQSGLTQGTVLALQSAIRAGGGDAAALQETMAGLVGRLKEAKIDGSSAAKAYEDLGIALKTTDGQMRSTDEILADILDKIAATPGETDRATTAVALLGESGAKTAAALAGGSAQVEEWRAKTAELNEALQEGAADGAAYNQAMEEMGIAVETVKIRMGNDLLPVVAQLASAFATVIGPLKQVSDTLSYLTNAPGRVAEGFLALGDSLREMLKLDGQADLQNAIAGAERARTAYSGWDATMADLGLSFEEAADGARVSSEYFGAWDVEASKLGDTLIGVTNAATEEAAATERGAAAHNAAAAAVLSHGDAFNALVAAAEGAVAGENAFNEAAQNYSQQQIARDLAERESAARRAAAVSEGQQQIAEWRAAELEAYKAQQAAMEQAHQERIARTAEAEATLTAYIIGQAQQVASAALDLFLGTLTEMSALEERQAEDASARFEALQQQWTEGAQNMTDAEKAELAKRIDAAKIARDKEAEEAKAARQKAHKAAQAAAFARVVIDAATAAMALIPSFAYLGPGAPIAAAGVATGAALVQTAAILGAEPPQYRTGGVIGEDAPRTAGMASDQRLAAVEPGEVILRPDQARALGGMGGRSEELLSQAVDYLRRIAGSVAGAASPRYDAASALAGGYR